MNRLQGPNHAAVRSTLRVAGPVAAAAGLLMVAVALVSFFSSFGSFEPPRYFWCAFVGLPLLFAGLVMCKFGYMGDVLRYVAAESAPVAADTFNQVADAAAPGIRSVSRSVTEGVAEGRRGQPG